MKLSKIAVVMLGTKDLARAVAFYRDVLGVTVQSEIPGFAFLDAGGMTLALSEGIARASEHIVGATEVVFSVEGVREAHAALLARGVVFLNEPASSLRTDVGGSVHRSRRTPSIRLRPGNQEAIIVSKFSGVGRPGRPPQAEHRR